MRQKRVESISLFIGHVGERNHSLKELQMTKEVCVIFLNLTDPIVIFANFRGSICSMYILKR